MSREVYRNHYGRLIYTNKIINMKNYIKYKNGIRVDMMGNYHGGCKKSCCQNTIGFPTKKGISNNCKIKIK